MSLLICCACFRFQPWSIKIRVRIDVTVAFVYNMQVVELGDHVISKVVVLNSSSHLTRIYIRISTFDIVVLFEVGRCIEF